VSKFLLTLTGPSGSGKSTLERMLVETGVYERLISTTTRQPRDGEIDSNAYYFVSDEEFSKGMEEGKFVQTVEFRGNKYGVTKEEMQRVFDTGRVPVVVVEPSGVTQYRNALEGSDVSILSVFVTNEVSVLVDRFTKRWIESGATDGDYNANRLSGILAEHNWINVQQWDMVIEKFDEKTEKDTVAFLRSYGMMKMAA